MTGTVTAIDHVNKTFTVNGVEFHFESLSQNNLNGSRVEVEGVIINNQNIAREVEAEK